MCILIFSGTDCPVRLHMGGSGFGMTWVVVCQFRDATWEIRLVRQRVACGGEQGEKIALNPVASNIRISKRNVLAAVVAAAAASDATASPDWTTCGFDADT